MLTTIKTKKKCNVFWKDRKTKLLLNYTSTKFCYLRNTVANLIHISVVASNAKYVPKWVEPNPSTICEASNFADFNT